MRKIVESGYIVGVSDKGNDISKTEYNEILKALDSKPIAPNGYGYRLNINLEWELFKNEGGGL